MLDWFYERREHSYEYDGKLALVHVVNLRGMLTTKNEKPQFDAEEVLELIKRMATAYLNEGLTLKDDCSNYDILCKESLQARAALLIALDLESKE